MNYLHLKKKMLIIFVGFSFLGLFSISVMPFVYSAGSNEFSSNFDNADWYEIFNYRESFHSCSDHVIDQSNNIYIVGEYYASSASWNDIYVMKYDENGAQLWDEIISTSKSEWGVAIELYQNQIYVLGMMRAFGETETSVLVCRYDLNGNQLMNFTWEEPNLQTTPKDFCLDQAGNIYVTGYIGINSDDGIIIKFDSQGNYLWNQTYGGLEYNRFYSVDVCDSALFVGGTTRTPDGTNSLDFWLIKFDFNGVPLWNKTWGGSDGDHGMCIKLCENDGIYIGGKAYSFAESSCGLVILKYDYNGLLLWNRSIDTEGQEWINAIESDLNGDIYCTGFSTSLGLAENETLDDMIILKYSTEGDLLWNTTWSFKEDTHSTDHGTAISFLSDNSMIISGQSQYYYDYPQSMASLFIQRYNPLVVDDPGPDDPENGIGINSAFLTIFISIGIIYMKYQREHRKKQLVLQD